MLFVVFIHLLFKYNSLVNKLSHNFQQSTEKFGFIHDKYFQNVKKLGTERYLVSGSFYSS